MADNIFKKAGESAIYEKVLEPLISGITSAALSQFLVTRKDQPQKFALNPHFRRRHFVTQAITPETEARIAKIFNALDDETHKVLNEWIRRLGKAQKADFGLSILEFALVGTTAEELKDSSKAALNLLRKIAAKPDDEMTQYAVDQYLIFPTEEHYGRALRNAQTALHRSAEEIRAKSKPAFGFIPKPKTIRNWLIKF